MSTDRIDYYIEDNPDGTYRVSIPRFDDDDAGLDGIRSFPSRMEAQSYVDGLSIHECLIHTERYEDDLDSGAIDIGEDGRVVGLKAVLDPDFIDDGSMGHRPTIILVERT